jgi:hypothetical protein
MQAAVYAMMLVAVAVATARECRSVTGADGPGSKPVVLGIIPNWLFPRAKKALIAPACIVASFSIPAILVPITAHPLAGWGLSLLGSLALLMSSSRALRLRTVPLLAFWLLLSGSLLVMALPLYKNGIIRAFAIVAYIGLATPLLWASFRASLAGTQKKSLTKSDSVLLKAC